MLKSALVVVAITAYVILVTGVVFAETKLILYPCENGVLVLDPKDCTNNNAR